MTAPPTTLHARLRAELDRRLAVARAATDVYDANWGIQLTDTGWRACTPDEHGISVSGAEEIAEHIALHDPADAIRRYAGEREVLERHVPTYQIPKTEGGIRWVCKSRCKPETCVELSSLAARLGVNDDEH